MAGQTPFYGMAYFDFRDRLDLPVNVRKEIDRFLLIDKQLYGLYTIFGNGVISGWTVREKDRTSTSSNPIALTIEPGIGIIGLVAAETSAPTDLLELPSNDTFDIYATVAGGTSANRVVRFVWSRLALGSGSVRLARVTTGSASILSVDTAFRDEIGFIELIREEVANHKHRGSPTKINLRSETRNQLPGARVEDFDASKVVSGRLDPERIPVLDHNDLTNKGLLTHAGLDSFVRVITSGNRELLGEVASTNLMKLLTAWKYSNPEVEDGFNNNIVVIPGITDNSFIDFDASTAYIGLPTNCISGMPTATGQISSVFWETTTAFLTAHDRNLVTIASDQVALTRGGSSSLFIENFEQVASGNVAIPGFFASTEVIDDNLGVTSEDADTLRTQGFYSGKFNTDRDFRILYTRTLSANRDWSLFDEIVLDVKSLSLSHGAVFMYFINEDENGTEQTSSEFLVLGEDEITTNPDPDLNGFERRSFSIENVNRGNITKIVFYTDDTRSKFEFWVDNIFLRNQALYPPEGFIRFRYSSQVPVVFNSINYETQVPDGTDIRFRVRTANSPTLLNRASYGSLLNSGDVFSLEGTDIEIDVLLLSDEDRSSTPILDSLELQYIVASEEVGFSISDADEWDRGSYVNMERDIDEFTFGSFVKIADKIAVNNMYYTFKNVITEIDPDRVAVVGFQGARYPLSPKQAFNFGPNQGARGFKYAFSAYRLEDKNYIIADTDNDRIILAKPDGTFLKGLASHNIADETFFYPLTASYNARTGILTTAFSQEVEIDDIDLTKIRLWIGGSFIDLGPNDTLVEPTKTKRILEINLSRDKREQLRETASNVSVQYRTGAFPIDFQPTASSEGVIGLRGIEVFLGDMTFIDGIRRPIFANVLNNGNWILANSSIAFDEAGAAGASVRVEVKVGETASFDVEVDEPDDGFVINWSPQIPAELTNIISTSSPPPGNRLTVNVQNPTADLVREYTLIFIANYVNNDDQTQNFSTQTQVVLAILPEDDSGGGGEITTAASILEVDVDNEEVEFSYDLIRFSDFSLGSVYEVDDNFFLIAGIVSLEDDIPPPGGGQTPPDGETFQEEAIRKLTGYRGKVILLSRDSKSISFQYDTPDGSYASDAVIDSNGNYVIAESSFVQTAGRVVKVDDFGNVIWQIGGGEFSKINDVRALLNDNIIVST
tara:strand:- start:5245 stop:8781 length:3537 start_codon:yes stop_codon:yes gene_type:complete